MLPATSDLLPANDLLLCTLCTSARFLSHASFRILLTAQAGRTLSAYAPGVVLRPRSGYVPRWRAIALRRRQATVDSDSMYDSVPAHVAALCARPSCTMAPHAPIPTPTIAHIRFPVTAPLRRTTAPRSSCTVSPPPPRVVPHPRAHPSSWTRVPPRVNWYASFTNAPSRSRA
ncbi:hypothetical protein C8R44DRAFT_895962 [Mycena epipterygia]|nr:hypothetical protein C8R44DRAFT_895962 [Mycena epipterygia]